MSSIKSLVYIVDDDESFRESLEELVSTMGYQTCAFSSAEAFLKYPRAQRPACLLLDVYLPHLDGFAVQEKLQVKEAALPIIFITGHGDVPMSVKAIKKGAVDFLLKPFNAKALRTTLVAALDKDVENVKKETLQQKTSCLISTLTPREREVMQQLITGKLNKQIAAVLGTAEKTIRKHRGRIMKKMQVTSVVELARILKIVV
jgi:FixJ family two-component response regulator